MEAGGTRGCQNEPGPGNLKMAVPGMRAVLEGKDREVNLVRNKEFDVVSTRFFRLKERKHGEAFGNKEVVYRQR